MLVVVTVIMCRANWEKSFNGQKKMKNRGRSVGLKYIETKLHFRGKCFSMHSQSFFYSTRVLLFFEIELNYGRSGPLFDLSI